MTTGEEAPTVSVILAVRDEIDHIDETLGTLTSQDDPRLIEIIVADGGSSDGTVDRIVAWKAADPRIKLIGNDRKRQSHGLNAAAAVAAGDYLVRADGHTRYARDYVRRSVDVAMETGGAAGGPMNPIGTTPLARAVAAVMNTRWLMPARFHHAKERRHVDTVYLGAFARDDFLRIGGYRALPSGAGEDPDFYYRWRRSGYAVVVDPAIRSEYRPRTDLRALWRQYFRYGRAKAEMLWINRRLPSWRPLAPPLLVAGLVAGLGLAAAAGIVIPLLALVSAWIAFVAVAAATADARPDLFLACTAVMHVSYGLGLLGGLLRRPAVEPARTQDRSPS